MTYYLLAMRSLTYAQKAQNAIARAGIRSQLLKTPAELSPKGCSHSLRVTANNKNAAVSIISNSGIQIMKIFVTYNGMDYREA